MTKEIVNDKWNEEWQMTNNVYVILSENHAYVDTFTETEFSNLSKLPKAKYIELQVIENVHICKFLLYVPHLKKLISKVKF